MRLEGKTALITGGGSGFGAGIARKFAAEGAQVFVADINAQGAEAVASEIGNGASPVQLDVADGGQWAALADRIATPDILVNNAGITHLPTPMEEIEEAVFDRIMAVNVKSVYHAARAFVGGMRARGSGAA